MRHLRPHAIAFAVVFALSAFVGSRTCDWTDDEGCDVAVTQYGNGYQGTRVCNGQHTYFSGSGSYGTPGDATCVNTDEEIAP